MPKKLNTNPKAQEARDRKEQQKKDNINKLVQQVEAEQWADEGSTRTEQKRKQEEERKRIEAEKRAAKKALQEKDAAELAKSLAATKKQPKTTAYDMMQQQQKSLAEQKKLVEQKEMEKKKIISIDKLVQIDDNVDRHNVNQLQRDVEQSKTEQFGGKQNVIEATGIDSALTELTSKLHDTSIDLSDRHPEKRLKAAFKEYETVHWPILKSENPTLRHSQLKELLWQQWLKAPQNPLNQARAEAAND